MTGSRVIEVPLPESAQPTPGDLELLETALQALVSARYEMGGRWEAVRRDLESHGWSVRCGLAWHVEARRGRELEECCGRTRDEAFARLNQVTHATSVEGCP